jgi:nucleoside-diphosphate-sugar epimerase
VNVENLTQQGRSSGSVAERRGAVAVTVADTDLCQRLVRRLHDLPDVAEVRLIGLRESDEELNDLLADVECIVHLAFVDDTEWRPRGTERDNVSGTVRLLRAATDARVPHLVVLSSAMVYGAWPNNPVPLTEEASLRPNPEFAYANQHAQIEQLVADWVMAEPNRTAAALRPCIVLGERGQASWIMRSLAAAAGTRLADADPPAQFLSADDLLSAIDLARRDRLDGPFNVAPDGWIPGETVRALAGQTPRLRLPDSVSRHLASWSWRFQRGPIPPGLLPYASATWLVANDRLRSAGWTPRRTSEQAYVAGTEAKWWTLLSPKRKQELTLGVSVAGGVIGLIAAAVIARRFRSGRRAGR